jgi:aryl sulfotransferase
MPVRPPIRDCVIWQFDSRRWAGYVPRPDDIVIATYPKSGTTWMQRIVGMLVFQSADPQPVMDVSIWPDARFRPVEDALAALEAQTHRRFIKAHLSYDALPIHDEVRYIHVARDGRDAALSYHHHLRGMADVVLERFDGFGLAEATLGRPFPRPPEDAADFFHRWMTEGAEPGATDGLPLPSWFDFELSWWEARDRENVLMVHYADLKADLDGEMRRIAGFLGIETPEALWQPMIEAAGFDAMQREGAGLLGKMAAIFRDGGAGFIHKGANGRWRDVYRADDLALYDACLARLPEDCAHWLTAGRLAVAEEGEASVSAG